MNYAIPYHQIGLLNALQNQLFQKYIGENVYEKIISSLKTFLKNCSYGNPQHVDFGCFVQF